MITAALHSSQYLKFRKLRLAESITNRPLAVRSHVTFLPLKLYPAVRLWKEYVDISKFGH